MNGREEPSFGRRRRRSLPEDGDSPAAPAEPSQDPVLTDPNKEKVEPQDEEVEPDEEGEHVKQLLSVSGATALSGLTISENCIFGVCA